ncbi:HlyD family type I secretion periplasmic adaptor subunit [Reyranella soli]|uniref:Membrane fusion protein (MFP) family protein n=1 Tax=Reyranella soli TaxID=1230389 RepID=A0A512NI69_9HYPH|nr:HlyD family type I secretion periplasmic adaptor subunit [Reyranella soli]GEP58639.1 HlyD family type I secretion periplasmic adaptor subunit [Reyranella soli]
MVSTSILSGRSRAELAFLPAALEIIEAPPSPIGRAIAITVVVVACLAAAWASVGTVDIVAVAQGRVIPSGRTKLVQPLEAGIVRAIHVRDGQRVRAGEVLIELDPTVSGAELERLNADLTSALLDVARLRAALATDFSPLAAFQPPPGATHAQVEMHRGFLASQITEQERKVGAVDKQKAQKEAERGTLSAMIERLEATLPLIEHRVSVRKHLSDRELGSRLQYLADLQELTATQQEVLVLKSRSVEADAALAATDENRARTVAEYRRTLFDELNRAEQKAAGLRQEVVKARQKAEQQQLVAPAHGIVHQLAVHTVGGVVTAAQPLVAVVPVDGDLEIEAIVNNRDVGFIRVGQEAEIKIDAFNFTRYGLATGRVLTISSDSVARHGDPQRSENRPLGPELEYVARIALNHGSLRDGNPSLTLSPGMTATVEIKTGTRTVVDYLLSPLARYRQESLRER